MSVVDKHTQATWQPPTPRSTFRPLPPTSTLPVDHLVLLPPPLLPHDDPSTAFAFSPAAATKEHPSPPTSRDSFASSKAASPSAEPDDDADDVRDGDWVPPTTSSKRPRRSAAIAAARNIPRQPSPFDLEGGEPDDDDADDPDAPSPSASPPASSARAGSSASSRRKVSHSLIERRRREKINECLAQLRETVPTLREEGERKVARARERGRKRGRGGGEGEGAERGGLHKLEILQGTILHIERLRTRIDELEAAAQQDPRAEQLRSPESCAGSTSSRKPSAPRATVKLEPDGPPTPPLVQTPRLSSAGTVDDHEASLLLLELSTSPELRPVVV
ncbi:hypothetical protein JCM9279_000146 [Rhodotorula babjevae]